MLEALRILSVNADKHIKVLEKINKYLSHKIKLPALGHYSSLNDEDLLKGVRSILLTCEWGQVYFLDIVIIILV